MRRNIEFPNHLQSVEKLNIMINTRITRSKPKVVGLSDSVGNDD